MGAGAAREAVKGCVLLEIGPGAGGAGSPLVWLEGFLAADFAAAADDGGGGHDSMRPGGATQNHTPRTAPR